jgi:hypothetical protein
MAIQKGIRNRNCLLIQFVILAIIHPIGISGEINYTVNKISQTY